MIQIRKWRALRHMTQQQVADSVEVVHSTVQRWESGVRSPGSDDLEKLAHLFGCEVADLWRDPDASQYSQVASTVPMVGYVGAGERYYPDPLAGPWGSIETVEAPPGDSDGIVAVRVRGTSMEPVYRDGDLLYLHRPNGWDQSACIGRDCVCELEDGCCFVKRLKRSEGVWSLESYNAEPIEGARIKWAQPILWVRRG